MARFGETWTPECWSLAAICALVSSRSRVLWVTLRNDKKTCRSCGEDMVHRRGRLQGWNLCHCFCCANTKFALPKFRNDKICVNTLQVFWVFFFFYFWFLFSNSSNSFSAPEALAFEGPLQTSGVESHRWHHRVRRCTQGWRGGGVCVSCASVRDKQTSWSYKSLGEYRDLASIKPWIPLNWSPTLRIFALSPGIVSVLNGVRFWGASLLFMMDSNAIWKRDAERIDT